MTPDNKPQAQSRQATNTQDVSARAGAASLIQLLSKAFSLSPSELIAVPAACTIVMSISAIWPLGIVGLWLAEFWRPISHAIWHYLLEVNFQIELTADQKDIATLFIFLLPQLLISVYQPWTKSGRSMLTVFTAIYSVPAFVGISSSSIVRATEELLLPIAVSIATPLIVLLLALLIFGAFRSMEEEVLGTGVFQTRRYRSHYRRRAAKVLLIIVLAVFLSLMTIHLLLLIQSLFTYGFEYVTPEVQSEIPWYHPRSSNFFLILMVMGLALILLCFVVAGPMTDAWKLEAKATREARKAKQEENKRKKSEERAARKRTQGETPRSPWPIRISLLIAVFLTLLGLSRSGFIIGLLSIAALAAGLFIAIKKPDKVLSILKLVILFVAAALLVDWTQQALTALEQLAVNWDAP